MLILKCSFEAQSTGDGGVADWHSIDLHLEVIRWGDRECAERVGGYMKPRKCSARTTGGSLSVHIRKRGGNAHRFLCVRKNCNNKRLD